MTSRIDIDRQTELVLANVPIGRENAVGRKDIAVRLGLTIEATWYRLDKLMQCGLVKACDLPSTGRRYGYFREASES